MNKTTGFRSLLLLALSFLALIAIGCGAAEPAAEAPAEATPVTTDAEPLPELRTNEAGAVLVTQDEILRQIDAGTAPLILDVRTPEEFAEGHVPGAVNISHDELAERMAEIEAAREAGVIVYCRSGRRAGIAEQMLLSEGFSNVQHLEGDMLAWLEAERPLENSRQ